MSGAHAHILIVDDDNRIRELLKRYLVSRGFRVTGAESAAAARRLMGTLAFDLAILDIMMPGEDGLSLLSALRSDGLEIPVILLTARGLAGERIEGLRAGADDYLAKPFEPEELGLRVTAILRRAARSEGPAAVVLSGLVFDPDRGELSDGQNRIRLTEAEVHLLVRLAATPGEPVSRTELAKAASAGLERSVDVQVTRLRRKIEPDPKQPLHLQTVRGVGYRLVVD